MVNRPLDSRNPTLTINDDALSIPGNLQSSPGTVALAPLTTGWPMEVIATPGNGYNADGTRLDPDALNTILTWLHRILTPSDNR